MLVDSPSLTVFFQNIGIFWSLFTCDRVAAEIQAFLIKAVMLVTARFQVEEDCQPAPTFACRKICICEPTSRLGVKTNICTGNCKLVSFREVQGEREREYIADIREKRVPSAVCIESLKLQYPYLFGANLQDDACVPFAVEKSV